MKSSKGWLLGITDIQVMPTPRHRTKSRRPLWIIVLVCLVCISLIGAYVYPPQGFSACYFLSSSVCSPFKEWHHWLPPEPAREYTDDELAALVVAKNILSAPSVQLKNPKIAFMFLTPGSLPFEKLWERFFLGHEERFSIYVHASREKPVHDSPLFAGRDIHSDKVAWGKVSMVDAEKRLLANALEDTNNQHFVLLSDSCVPLHNFDYVYSYLMETNVSFVDCFEDPGPHGTGRFPEHMLPEIEEKDWRKGAQWFSVKRQHALLIMADSLYYTKFKHYCKPVCHSSCKSKLSIEAMNPLQPSYCETHMWTTHGAYNQTALVNSEMADPGGIVNWSVTHVDWSEGKWHPKAYRAHDVTFDLLKNIASIDESVHVTSDAKRKVMQKPCLWNGVKRPCYLFARKFYPEALDNLMHLFSNFTAF